MPGAALIKGRYRGVAMGNNLQWASANHWLGVPRLRRQGALTLDENPYTSAHEMLLYLLQSSFLSLQNWHGFSDVRRALLTSLLAITLMHTAFGNGYLLSIMNYERPERP